jgi:hypothetical protein
MILLRFLQYDGSLMLEPKRKIGLWKFTEYIYISQQLWSKQIHY